MERRPPFNFTDMNIPEGSMIYFHNNKSVEAKVINGRQVEYKGQVTYLTPITKELIRTNHALDPTDHWYYKDTLLKKVLLKNVEHRVL